MQFSYLSFSFLNHIERFGFSNTFCEMSSLYSAAMEEKAEQKKYIGANKSLKKTKKQNKIHHFTSQGARDLLITWVKSVFCP